MPIAMTSDGFATAIDDIGLTYKVKSDRFNLSSGNDMVLVAVEGKFLANQIILTLWGGASVVVADTVINGADTVINGADFVVNTP